MKTTARRFEEWAVAVDIWVAEAVDAVLFIVVDAFLSYLSIGARLFARIYFARGHRSANCH
jgi:hypothetical protein